jgi:Protein of unknown function (DUF3489)
MPKPTKKASHKAAASIEPTATTVAEPNHEAQATTTASAAPQAAQVPPAGTASKKGATARKGVARGRKAARTSTTRTVMKKAAKPEQAAAREGTKKGLILGLLRRKNGATMAEIAQVTGWEKHSIRGFVSGTVSKRLGFKVESTRSEAGRNYRIIAR